MNNLRVSVALLSFGYLFLLVAAAADSSTYHDIGPLHIDSNLVSLIHARHNETKNSPFLQARIFSLIPPESAPHHNSFIFLETFHTPQALLFHFSSRAPPAAIATKNIRQLITAISNRLKEGGTS